MIAVLLSVVALVAAKSYSHLYVNKGRSQSDADHPVTLFVKYSQLVRVSVAQLPNACDSRCLCDVDWFLPNDAVRGERSRIECCAMVRLSAKRRDLLQVSTPGSPKYGQHLSFNDMKRFSDEKAFERTMAYLKSMGATVRGVWCFFVEHAHTHTLCCAGAAAATGAQHGVHHRCRHSCRHRANFQR
jgi:hypothetical protein